MHTRVKIYFLSDPRNSEIPKYIGKTVESLNERLSKHINNINKGNNKKNSWIKSLLKQDLKPNIFLLDEVPIEEWSFWEKHYISLYKSFGFNLKNHSNGGEDGLVNIERSNLTKIKISNAIKGRKLSKEHIEKIRKVRTGWKLSEETKKKISEVHKGRIFSNEHKNNISISKIGTISIRRLKVLQYDLEDNFIKEWDSATIAAKELNLSRNNIVATLKGRRNKCGNFKWKYSSCV